MRAPIPRHNCDSLLPELAYETGNRYADRAGPDHRSGNGLYLTPPTVARSIARRLLDGRRCPDILSILDPAAGSGVLGCALVEALLQHPDRPRRIRLTCCEIDPALAEVLRSTLGDLEARAGDAGCILDWEVLVGDFLLGPLAGGDRRFDLIIANPPYFKMAKDSPAAARHRDLVFGQPNAYGLFIGTCSRILAAVGRMAFITPRSFMSGRYFTRVRGALLAEGALTAIHEIASRTDTFGDDAVLQEAVIFVLEKCAAAPAGIRISRSYGIADIDADDGHLVATEVCIAGPEQHIRLINGEDDLRLLAALDKLPSRLDTLGLRIATGPVVPFRMKEAVLAAPTGDRPAPLLWLPHVLPMRINWDPSYRKGGWIDTSAAKPTALVINQTLVLLRRFSPKEDDRRVVAAPYSPFRIDIRHVHIGIENHLNYIVGGMGFSDDVARGLAAYLNSRAVDRYFRLAIGSTQIGAHELRNLPIPDIDGLLRLDWQILRSDSLDEIDSVVNELLQLDG